MLRNIKARMENELEWTLYQFVSQALKPKYVPFVEVAVVAAGFAMEAINREEKMWQKLFKAHIVEAERINP